ncbi:unnamed protein product [Spirodela intermedia]|uniref:Uncharacterized protein n=1 Tax=Spirodela intermedia TaxID=51605 RepID=A0A7I8IYF9_SPIIN|nr:unnamed protein product [Spirodela intermedia]CAA6662042.1 unnamed protein product [Spirodela intermedia]
MVDDGVTAAPASTMRQWIVENKLKTVFLVERHHGSFAYNWSRPNMKTSVKIIHARASLWRIAGAAAVEYYDRQYGRQLRHINRRRCSRRTHDN